MFVFDARARIFDREADFLKRRAPVFIGANCLFACAFQRAEQAERRIVRRAFAIVGAVHIAQSLSLLARDLDHAVLLPIDMQQAFDAPPWPRRWNDEVDANGLALLDTWRSAGRPIIHVRHDSVEPGSSLAPGTAGNALRPGFEPRAGEPLKAVASFHGVLATDVSVKPGDTVLFKKYGPDEIEVGGKTYLVGDEDDILAILE